jgi:hypothetical protein
METPKESVHRIMLDLFDIVENMTLNEETFSENKFLQVSDLFKQMNINIDRLQQLKTELHHNVYYRRVLNRKTIHRLTEAQKLKHQDYGVCNCGRVIKMTKSKNSWIQDHLKSQVHYQGLRNRKYAGKHNADELANEDIKREIVIHAFIINHLKNIKTD